MAVEDRLLRALALVRVLVLVNMVALTWYRFDAFQHPTAGLATVVGISLWTVLALAAYGECRWRTPALLLLDLGVAVAAILVTPWLKGDGFNATVPGFWVMGPLLAWAAHWRLRGGLIAGALLAACDLGVRQEISQNNIGNAFLLLIGGPTVGYLAGSLQQMATERDRAQAEAAAAAERTRLARAVHDGVLQVLAMVQRCGPSLGADGERLAVLASEQEAALRRMIHAQDVGPVDAGSADLTTALAALERRPRVQVVLHADSVALSPSTVRELTAAVCACLDNTALHAGESASSWVLLDDQGDHVTVTVRDDGPGIAAGRLDEARAAGRLGVASSIQGRLEDLGGQAQLRTGAFGTEWELSVPVADPPR